MRYSFYAALVLLLLLLSAVELLYSSKTISLPEATAYSSMALSLLFSLIVFVYLLAKGRTLKAIISELGLSRRRLLPRYVMMGILLFLLFLFMEVGVSLISELTGMQFPTNVSTVLGSLPLYFYAFTVAIAPINEEILFRGFLAPRIGIVGSSVIFAALHYISYFSVTEFIAALAFGIISAYIFKRTKSLYPSIVGHVLINLIGIITTFFA